MTTSHIKIVGGSLPGPQGGLFDHLVSGADDRPHDVTMLLETLRQAMTSGGEYLRVTSELPDIDTESPKDLFDVLALDVAITFPRDLSGSSLIGRQACWCQSSESGNAANNWYREALDHYFKTPPGGSLLAHPDLRLNANRWWLLSPGIPVDSTATCGQPFVRAVEWFGTFNPGDGGSSPGPFDGRFRQFGEAVFGALARHMPAESLQASAIVWVYVAPLDSGEMNVPHPLVNRWDASVFAVIQPSDLSAGVDWPDRDRVLRTGLVYAVQDMYFTLALGARSELERHSVYSRMQFSAVQAVAHDYKNQMRDISTLGGMLSGEVGKVARSIPNDLPGRTLLLGLSDRVERLSTLCRLTSAIALATFWLANPATQEKVSFRSGSNRAPFAATVAQWLLSVYQVFRKDWIVVSAVSPEELEASLQAAFGTCDSVNLVQRLDFALLVFVLSEPIRNVRATAETVNGTQVRVSAQARDDAIVICQRTLERRDPGSELPIQSLAAAQVNRLLRLLQPAHSEPFAHIDETVRVVRCTPTERGRFWIERETSILIRQLPTLAGQENV